MRLSPVTSRILRCVTVFILVFGLVAPKAGAVVLQWLPGMQAAVICTGQGMITLVLGPDGQPVTLEDGASDICLGTKAVNGPDAPVPAWHRLARSYEIAFSSIPNQRVQTPPALRQRPSRAPPVQMI